MHIAVVSYVAWRLQTIHVRASHRLRHTAHVLPEVQMLRGVDFAADGVLEVFVRDFAVAVGVEFVEERLELLLRQVNAPVFEVVLKFLRHNGARLVLIQVYESLLKRLPLELYLVQYCLLNIQFKQLSAPFHRLFHPSEHTLFVWRVLNRIMPKVKTLTLVNRSTYPTGKISITQIALAFRIFLLDKLSQIVEVHVFAGLSVVPYDVLRSHEPVVVKV